MWYIDIDYIKHAVHHSVSIWHDLFEFGNDWHHDVAFRH